MSTYAWPQAAGWYPNRFEMRIVPNVLTFTSQYNKSQQVIDLLGERWRIIMDLPDDNSSLLGGAREAFFDRLKGPLNYISIGHQVRRVPQGTMRDGAAVGTWTNNVGATGTWTNNVGATGTWTGGPPALRSALAQLANIATIQTVPYASLKAGDHVGLGAGGQLVRAMADAVAGSDGLLVFDFSPRARAAVPAYTAVVWNYPTATFRLVSDGVPVSWRPGAFSGSSLELIEVI